MNIDLRATTICSLALYCLLCLPYGAWAASDFERMFGFKEVRQPDFRPIPQWPDVMMRHSRDDRPQRGCRESFFHKCCIKSWLRFVNSIKDRPRREQIEAVNRFGNRNPYVLDMVNYGQEDYWAIIREFLSNGGDCEDYAITKFFSLKWLGFPMDDIRIVILQDTNLRTPHAVMAVHLGDDILIMDNQTNRVISHKKIAHYVPLYSLNTKGWWLHLPPGL